MAKLDIGIDLGTTSVLIYIRNKGIVLNEPSVIAINTKTGKIIAKGSSAYKILGKTPDTIKAILPLENGVISNYDAAQKMVRAFVEDVIKTRLFKPRIAICIPTNVTQIEAMAVINSASFAGARKVFLIKEPLAAAIGCGIDVSKPCGNLIIDIGGGTVDIAVISLSAIVISTSVKYGGNYLTQRIKKFIQKNSSIVLGDKMTENLKKQIASTSNDDDVSYVARGRDILTGLPKNIEITQNLIHDIVCEYADTLYTAVKSVLEKTPPELVGDIYNNGGILTGGGALLDGLAPYLSEKLGFKIKVADNPVECVAIGTGNSFKYIGTLGDGFITQSSFEDKTY